MAVASLCGRTSHAIGRREAERGPSLLPQSIIRSQRAWALPCQQHPLLSHARQQGPAIAGQHSASTCSERRLTCGAVPEHQSGVQGGYPFHEADFHRLTFVPAPFGPMKLYEDSHGGSFSGLLLFKREQDISDESLSVLEVFVAGDTAFNTFSLLSHRSTDRPMTHDLLWTLLERAHTRDSQSWTLLRVAIVDMQNNVFIGRLFFGDPRTGEVEFDCDCRPSDGCYLAIKAKCPFFVSQRVWDCACIPIQHTSAYRMVNGSSPAQEDTQPYVPPATTSSSTTPRSSSSSGAASSHVSSAGGSLSEQQHISPYTSQYRSGIPGGRPPAPAREPPGRPFNANATPDTLTVEDVTLLRPDDAPAIQLLKRELVIAVAEENYAEAVRIRDHEWMKAYRLIHALRLQGKYEEASVKESLLKRSIEGVAEAA